MTLQELKLWLLDYGQLQMFQFEARVGIQLLLEHHMLPLHMQREPHIITLLKQLHVGILVALLELIHLHCHLLC